MNSMMDRRPGLYKSICWGLIASLMLPASFAAVESNTTPGANGSINQLPSYHQAKKIDDLLDRNQQPKYVDQIPPEIRQELQALRASQQQLMEQLSNLKNRPSQPIQQSRPMTQMDQEAASSAIFFAGGAPRLNQQQEQNQQQNQQQGKGAAAQQSKNAKLSSAQKQINFLNQDGKDDTQSKHTMQDPTSPYMVMEGTYIPAVLQTAINSDVPGLIKARVTRNVYDTATGRYLLVPQGTTLVGLYNSDVKYGDERAQIKFTRMIRPDGSSIVLSAPPGMNDIGESGLKGDVDNHWGAIIGAGLLGVLFNIPAIVASNNQTSTYNTSTNTWQSSGTNAGQAAAQSLGQTSSQIGGKIADRSLNLKPTLRLPVGTLFSVFTRKDMVIPPYTGGA